MAKAKLESVLRRLEDMGYKTTVDKVLKNGIPFTAITYLCGTVCPVTYFEMYLDDNPSDEVVASRIAANFEKAIRQTPVMNFDPDEFIKNIKMSDLEARVCAMGSANKDVISKPYLEDLEIYAVVRINAPEDDYLESVRITEAIYKASSVLQMATDDEIISRALKNSFKKSKIYCYSEILIDKLKASVDNGTLNPDDYEEMVEDIKMSDIDSLFGIISNDICLNGAIVLADKQILAKYAKKIDDSFYILPSSLHEVICIAANNVGNVSELKNMVLEVNNTGVDPLDKLTDSVYFYDRLTKTIRKVA